MLARPIASSSAVLPRCAGVGHRYASTRRRGPPRDALWPPQPTWSVDQIPDLTSKVFLVTGGNIGLGFETTKQLLRNNAKVYLAARSQKRAEDAIAALRAETGRDAHFLPLDLADLPHVQRAAQKFLSGESRLDALILNAGLVYPPLSQLTAQGYDMTLGVNLLGHFLLYRLLHPALTATPASRAIWLSSVASFPPARIDTRAFRDPEVRKKIGVWGLYAQSKLGMIIASNVAAKRDDGVVSIAVDPGQIKTNIFHGQEPWYWRPQQWLGQPVEKGALTQLFAATAPEAAEYNGKYMYPFARLCDPPEAAEDEKTQSELWEYLEAQTQEYLPS